MTEPASRLRVLVLEDEFLIADEIATMIEEAGYGVLGPAASVEEALALLSADEPPDLAVIDANLRGASSLPVAEQLRAQRIPFCVCTGYRSDSLTGTFGDVVVLPKPVTSRALIAAIRSLPRPAEAQT